MTHKLLLTLDSLRFDVFEAADAPFLKSLGDWKKAYAQATYTFPAHMSAFVGKFPQTLDGSDFYDPFPMRHNGHRTYRAKDFWRLCNPEAPRDAHAAVGGRNIVEGFAAAGHTTIGTGGMSWFNPATPPGAYLTDPFEHFKYFDGPDLAAHRSAPLQGDWLLEQIAREPARPKFIFWNIGETHARFEYEGCPWQGQKNPYGDRAVCLERQRLCLEFVDGHIRRVVETLGACDMVIFADHGEAMGEDGLWGHGFCCPSVMEVPMLIRVSGE